MQAFRDHLGTDQNVDLAGPKCAERFAISLLACHRIGVHPFHHRLRKDMPDRSLNFLGAESGVNQRILSALRTFFWNSRGMSAKMTAEAQDRAMKGESDAAIGTITRPPAIAADQRRGKTAPIEKKNGLFTFVETLRHRGAQFVRENCAGPVAPLLLPQIDDSDSRHLAVVHALSQRRELIFGGERVMVTLEGR